MKQHLPKAGQRGGRWASFRRIINRILYRNRTGMPWRDLPTRFGKWKTVGERHGHSSADGTWDRLFAAFLADADAQGSIDWSMCRWLHHLPSPPARGRSTQEAPADRERRAPRQHRPDEGLGRSRGGHYL